MSTPHTLGQTFYDHGNVNGDPDLLGHTTDGGHVQGFTRARYVECEHYRCRPVVVLDPEDREQVNALVVALGDQGWTPTTAHGARDALRSLVADPKPEEPTGLGAVVEDAAGNRWVRVSGDGTGAMWRTPRNGWRRYADIAAVRVLSDGVTA